MTASSTMEGTDPPAGDPADLRLRQLFGANQKLDAQASQPLYSQIEELLRNLIRNRVLVPGDRLPTEKSLQRFFEVSRVTVRQAFGNLVRDGLISRCRGRGSEVNPPKIEVSFGGKASFTEAMRDLGFTLRTQILDDELCDAPDEVHRSFDLADGEEVWHLERLRIVQDERIVHFHHYLPRDLQPRSSSLFGSLYEYLDGRGLRPNKHREFVEAATADSVLATRLGIPVGSPLLRRVRIGSVEGRVVEYSIGHYRGDRYRYVFSLDT